MNRSSKRLVFFPSLSLTVKQRKGEELEKRESERSKIFYLWPNHLFVSVFKRKKALLSSGTPKELRENNKKNLFPGERMKKTLQCSQSNTLEKLSVQKSRDFTRINTEGLLQD